MKTLLRTHGLQLLHFLKAVAHRTCLLVLCRANQLVVYHVLLTLTYLAALQKGVSKGQLLLAIDGLKFQGITLDRYALNTLNTSLPDFLRL